MRISRSLELYIASGVLHKRQWNHIDDGPRVYATDSLYRTCWWSTLHPSRPAEQCAERVYEYRVLGEGIRCRYSRTLER